MNQTSSKRPVKVFSVRQCSLLLFIMTACVASAFAQQSATQTNQDDSRVITGRVVNESGQPLAGASVVAGNVRGGLSQRTSSDNEGYFKLHGLDAGLYRMLVNLPGYVGHNTQPDPFNPAPAYRPGDSVSVTLVQGGVISGIVTKGDGDPVVNVLVRAFRIRDGEGNKVRVGSTGMPRMTDDRGYYRIYGLQPGTYLIAAGGAGQYFGGVNLFANDSMTFAPSSTRDTAVEIIVRSDQEVTADISYRAQPGHAISGKVGGVLPPAPFTSAVRLTDVESQIVLLMAQASGEERSFQINAVSDGEYQISAVGGGGPNSEFFASPPRRISVRGTDVTGIELVMAPMGSIAGRVVLEPDTKLNCGRRRETALRETMVSAWWTPPEPKPGAQKSKEKSDEPAEAPLFPSTLQSAPNDGGEIRFQNLTPATYRLEVRAPGAGWYVREITGQRASAGRTSVNIPKNGIALKPGEKVADLAIAIAEGGGAFRGRVTTGEGQTLPEGLRLYLVPAERENSENVLRYFEGSVAADGKFAIGNLAPGRYWIIAEPAVVIDSNTVKSIRTDSALRAKIMRDAENIKREIVFKPCERTVDYELPFSPKP